MRTQSRPAPAAPGISAGRLRLLTFILATAAGVSVANIFYSQPLLDLIARTYHTTEGSAAIVVTVTQLGYAAGIAVLMPLGDLIENRALASAGHRRGLRAGRRRDGNGLWDLALLQAVPGLRMAAPRDLPSLREELGRALGVADAPTAIRFPRGAVGAAVPAVRRTGGVDVLRESDAGVLVVAVGAMARTALEAAELCARQGLETTVVDPRWVKPLPPELLRLATRYQRVVTVIAAAAAA
jgi:Transketolase, C-terminal domain